MLDIQSRKESLAETASSKSFSDAVNRGVDNQPDCQQETQDMIANERIVVTVLMPCLNEAETLADCIRQAKNGCEVALADSDCLTDPCDRTGMYEILVADNGSTDGSQEIASQCGARLIAVDRRGYGSALRSGIVAAKGRYVVIGDADRSYDFEELPEFLEKLKQGYDLVVGNRFAGGIIGKAMPWHHRYIGNPLLSGLGRLLYRTTCRDWHCGLRAINRSKFIGMKFSSVGMEFASEMIMRAAKAHRERSTNCILTRAGFSICVS